MGGIALAGCLAVSHYWSGKASATRERSDEQGTPRTQATAQTEATTASELVRLHAEVRNKDALIGVLAAAAQTRTPDASAEAQVAETPPAASDQEAQAVDALDERLYMAHTDPRRAAELEQALRGALNSVELTDVKIASLHCAPTLCKLALAAESQASINKAVEDTLKEVSKLFQSTVGLPLGSGQFSLYLGRTSQDTALPAPSESPGTAHK